MTLTHEDIITNSPAARARVVAALREAIASIEMGRFQLSGYSVEPEMWHPYSTSARTVQRAITERFDVACGVGPVSMFEIRIVHRIERSDSEMAVEFASQEEP